MFPIQPPPTPNIPTFDVPSQVTEAYTEILGRPPEAGAIEAWQQRAAASPLPPTSIAQQFFGSLEYLQQNHTAEDTVDRLFNFILDRPADEAGKQAYVNALNSGASVDQLIGSLYTSPEFKQTHLDMGTW